MTRLILVRHAESVANRDRRALGRGDSVLTGHGRQQARAVADLLRGEGFCRVVSSPLQRARRTAEAIAAPRGIVVQREEALIELDIGAMEGLPYSEARERFPEVIAGWWGDAGADVRMPDGESLSDVHARAWPFVEGLFRAPAPGPIVVVTHNWVIRAILCGALQHSLHEFRRFEVGLAAHTLLTLRVGRWQLHRFNVSCGFPPTARRI